MKSAIAHIIGESPYSQSKHYTEEDAPKKPKEAHDAYEQRTWRHRMHTTKDGRVEIPGMRRPRYWQRMAIRRDERPRGQRHRLLYKADVARRNSVNGL